MDAADPRSRAEGVGISYHPFLHDFLLDHSNLFDFVELPLDLYADPARSALLDPGQLRLQRIATEKRCVWRGSALSLGTPEPGGDPRFPSFAIRKLRQLLEVAQAAHLTEVIGFRTAKHGPLNALPFTPAAARWIAVRQAAACEALGMPVLLALPDAAAGAPGTGLDGVAFLGLIAAHGGTGFVVDAADLGSAGGRAEPPGCLPSAGVAALCVSSDDAAAWDSAAAWARHIRPRRIVLRRDRQLFPLTTITRDLRRAALLLAEPASAAHIGADPASQAREVSSWPGVSQPSTPYSGDAAPAAIAYPGPDGARSGQQGAAPLCGAAQDDGTTASLSWQNWRTQVDDMHRAQQIAALLARGGASRAPLA